MQPTKLHESKLNVQPLPFYFLSVGIKLNRMRFFKKKRITTDNYYLNYYMSKTGSKVRGNWKETLAEAEDESSSYLYTRKLGYTWIETATIEKSEVAKIAKEEGMTIGEVLQCV